MSKRVIVIEDSDDEQMLISRAIKRVPEQPGLTMLDSGEQALDYFRSITAMPDLVLVDIKMSRMGGIEFIKNVKKIERCKGIPFVCMSTSSVRSDVRDAYAAGANGYFAKPEQQAAFTRDLVSLISYWLSVNTSMADKRLA